MATSMVVFVTSVFSEEGNTQKCNNHWTISLVFQASKIMVKTLQRLMKAVAEEILAVDQQAVELSNTFSAAGY